MLPFSLSENYKQIYQMMITNISNFKNQFGVEPSFEYILNVAYSHPLQMVPSTLRIIFWHELTGLEPIFHMFRNISCFSDNQWIRRIPDKFNMVKECLMYNQFSKSNKLVDMVKNNIKGYKWRITITPVPL